MLGINNAVINFKIITMQTWIVEGILYIIFSKKIKFKIKQTNCFLKGRIIVSLNSRETLNNFNSIGYLCPVCYPFSISFDKFV